MSPDWVEIRLGDLGRVVTGKTPPTSEYKYFNGSYNFISPKDMGFDSRYITTSLTTITPEAIAKFKNQVIPKNTIMYTALSYGFGKMGLASDTCLTNQQINSIIVDETKYDFNFVYYLLRNSKNYFLTFNAGIVTPIVPKSTFQKIKLFVPKQKITQQKIAQILSAYDDLIENNLKRIKLLEEMAQITYEQWFVRMKFPNHETTPIDAETGLPEGWEKKQLIDVCGLVMGQSPKSEFYNAEKQGLPFHQGVKDYGFRFPTNASWSTEGKRIAKKGDILFSVRAPVGRLNIAIEKIILGRGLSAISHKEGYQSFLFYQLQKIFFEEDMMGGGAIFSSVTKNDMNRIEILVPSKNIIQNFNNLASTVDKNIVNLHLQNQHLKEARDILLPRLMTGMIDVDKIKLPQLLDKNSQTAPTQNKEAIPSE